MKKKKKKKRKENVVHKHSCALIRRFVVYSEASWNGYERARDDEVAIQIEEGGFLVRLKRANQTKTSVENERESRKLNWSSKAVEVSKNAKK